MKVVKIKDLPKDFQLVGLTLIIPKYVRKVQPELLPKMVIKSGWNKGFWGTKKDGDSRIYPVLFEDFKEVGKWKVELNVIQTFQLEGIKNE